MYDGLHGCEGSFMSKDHIGSRKSRQISSVTDWERRRYTCIRSIFLRHETGQLINGITGSRVVSVEKKPLVGENGPHINMVLQSRGVDNATLRQLRETCEVNDANMEASRKETGFARSVCVPERKMCARISGANVSISERNSEGD